MEFSSVDADNLLIQVEQLFCRLIFIKYFRLLGIFVVGAAELIPSVLTNTKNSATLAKIEAVLEAQ